jgi:hypothetical protein
MTPPDSDPGAYVAAIIALYLELPETPMSATLQDHRQARRWHEQDVPLNLAESALLLASLRRLIRPANLPPLSPIRSLAYFHPVIDELRVHPMPAHYLDYLRLKLNRIAAGSAPAQVQKLRFQTIANRPTAVR